jgi:FkbM family methyltransferase
VAEPTNLPPIVLWEGCGVAAPFQKWDQPEQTAWCRSAATYIRLVGRARDSPQFRRSGCQDQGQIFRCSLGWRWIALVLFGYADIAGRIGQAAPNARSVAQTPRCFRAVDVNARNRGGRNYTVNVSSPVVTWARWRRLSGLKYSLYRGLEYERLAGLVLPGRTLDLGGGKGASYLHLLDVRGPIVSVNLDTDMGPTLLADLNHPLPFKDAVFDDVVTLNTLEHVFEEGLAIREIVRVLRPGGRFHIGVPFLYRVHGSPDDYSRHTQSWWRRTLLSLDVDVSTLSIEPLTWDPLASAFALVEFNPVRRLLKKPLMLHAVIEDRGARRAGNPSQSYARRNADFALGYFITGNRPGSEAKDTPAPPVPVTRSSVTLAGVRSVARRIVDGVPLAERPAAFVVRSLLDQRHLVTGRHPSSFRYRGLRFTARPSDWNAVREVLIDGEYDAIDQLLKSERPRVVDLGANIGMFAVRVLAARPGAIVHSYEPDGATYALLEVNVRRNSGHAWRPFHAAAHAVTGSVRFASAATSTAGRVQEAGHEAVPSVSLRELLARFDGERVDLVKIDIEGSEEALLTADPGVLDGVDNVLIEVHPDLNDADAVVRVLQASFPHLSRIPGRASSKPLLVASRRQTGLPVYP